MQQPGVKSVPVWFADFAESFVIIAVFLVHFIAYSGKECPGFFFLKKI